VRTFKLAVLIKGIYQIGGNHIGRATLYVMALKHVHQLAIFE
jgi:hypothetical protein